MSECCFAIETGLWERGACTSQMHEPTGCVHRAGAGPRLPAPTALWPQTRLYFTLIFVFLCHGLAVIHVFTPRSGA